MALEGKKEPAAEVKEEGDGKGMEVDGKKDEDGAAESIAAVEPEQFKLYRATLDPSAKKQLDDHL
eukprot:12310649-Heterocapsa_arctica.AAC.1